MSFHTRVHLRSQCFLQHYQILCSDYCYLDEDERMQEWPKESRSFGPTVTLEG